MTGFYETLHRINCCNSAKSISYWNRYLKAVPKQGF